MLTKVGVNTTRAEKRGPIVREGTRGHRAKAFRKIVRCGICDAQLEKTCSDEMTCEISTLKCPKCGADVS